MNMYSCGLLCFCFLVPNLFDSRPHSSQAGDSPAADLGVAAQLKGKLLPSVKAVPAIVKVAVTAEMKAGTQQQRFRDKLTINKKLSPEIAVKTSHRCLA